MAFVRERGYDVFHSFTFWVAELIGGGFAGVALGAWVGPWSGLFALLVTVFGILGIAILLPGLLGADVSIGRSVYVGLVIVAVVLASMGAAREWMAIPVDFQELEFKSKLERHIFDGEQLLKTIDQLNAMGGMFQFAIDDTTVNWTTRVREDLRYYRPSWEREYQGEGGNEPTLIPNGGYVDFVKEKLTKLNLMLDRL